jgi:hypothetical protein
MTAVPPSGVVTFLFTDVEGSTRRWRQTPRGSGLRWLRMTRCCGRRSRRGRLPAETRFNRLG